MTLNTLYETYHNCYLTVDRYVKDGTPAIGIWNDEGPVAMLTVCLGKGREGGNESFVDTNNLSGAMEFINMYGLGRRTGISARSGFCVYPLVDFDMAEVMKHTEPQAVGAT